MNHHDRHPHSSWSNDHRKPSFGRGPSHHHRDADHPHSRYDHYQDRRPREEHHSSSRSGQWSSREDRRSGTNERRGYDLKRPGHFFGRNPVPSHRSHDHRPYHSSYHHRNDRFGTSHKRQHHSYDMQPPPKRSRHQPAQPNVEYRTTSSTAARITAGEAPPRRNPTSGATSMASRIKSEASTSADRVALAGTVATARVKQEQPPLNAVHRPVRRGAPAAAATSTPPTSNPAPRATITRIKSEVSASADRVVSAGAATTTTTARVKQAQPPSNAVHPPVQQGANAATASSNAPRSNPAPRATITRIKPEVSACADRVAPTGAAATTTARVKQEQPPLVQQETAAATATSTTARVKQEQPPLNAVHPPVQHGATAATATSTTARVKQEQPPLNAAHPPVQHGATSAATATSTGPTASPTNPNNAAVDPDDVIVISSQNNEEDESGLCVETHLIFAVDSSGSMKKADVKLPQKGKKKKNKNPKMVSRWNAVFECAKELVQEQLKEVSSASDVVVSLITFNDESNVIWERLPLDPNKPKAILKKLELARCCPTTQPSGGTNFSTGLEEARKVAQKTVVGGNVLLVFLSDGRPAGLPNQPATTNKKSKPITVVRNHGKDYPPPWVCLDQIKEAHGDRFAFHVICLYKEGKPWLDFLSKRYNGTLYTPELIIEDDVPAATSTSVSDDSKEEELVELKVKSAETLVREKFARAEAAGEMISIHGTTMAMTKNSMRATFHTISSVMTSMRNQSRKRLVERKIVLELPHQPSPMIQFPATRMKLDAAHDKILLASGEKPNGRLVKIAMQPFAQGGLRNVFRMTEITSQPGISNSNELVAKESRHEVPYAERLRFHCETSSCQARAAEYAQLFNARQSSVEVCVLCSEVYRLKDPSYPGGFRYVAVEGRIRGKYEKYNSNNGYVNPSVATSQPCQVAQAFSHFSYHHSGGTEMVVDIQGSGYTYTDPQLHSKERSYGRADRAESGFSDFFKTHKCNDICVALGLKHLPQCKRVA